LKDSLGNTGALKWPPSRRLIERDVPTFIELIRENGISEALSSLDFSREYIAFLGEEPESLKVVNHKTNGRTYTTPMSLFQEYISSDELKGLEPTVWNDVVHIGGIFSRTQHVHDVGSYTDSYATWGYEDVDLQWKLDEIFGIEDVPQQNKFEVIHLDHPKGYFSKEANERNRLAFERRQEEGVEKAILYDKGTNHE
jgi:hypothetical protein